MTQFPDLFAVLAAPFADGEIRQRSQAGRQLHYITARTAMNRLDAVLGPENWWDEYTPGENSVVCRLTVRLPDGSVLTKADAGGYAGMADSGDDDKSGFSDSFKRACVKFGVGRYLYRDGVPDFAREREPGPDPAPSSPTPRPAPKATWGNDPAPAARPSRRPTGRALFAWAKDHEERDGVGLIRHLEAWGRSQDYPRKIADWSAEQAELGLAEARRRLDTIQFNQEPGEDAA